MGFDLGPTQGERLTHISAPITLSIIGFTGGSAGYGMMYHAGKKTGKTDNEVMVYEIVATVEERGAGLV